MSPGERLKRHMNEGQEHAIVLDPAEYDELYDYAVALHPIDFYGGAPVRPPHRKTELKIFGRLVLRGEVSCPS